MCLHNTISPRARRISSNGIALTSKHSTTTAITLVLQCVTLHCTNRYRTVREERDAYAELQAEYGQQMQTAAFTKDALRSDRDSAVAQVSYSITVYTTLCSTAGAAQLAARKLGTASHCLQQHETSLQHSAA
jgi:hypothetical protein